VFGRTERYYVKRFEEETSLRTQVIIDGSGSMAYCAEDRPSKYHYACRIAAAIGYIVCRQQDALGLTIYDDAIRQQIPRAAVRGICVFSWSVSPCISRKAGPTQAGRFTPSPK